MRGGQGDLPRLAVLYDAGSIDVLGFAEAGRGLWQTIWLVDSARWPPGVHLHLMERCGTVVEMAGHEPAAIAARIGEPASGLVVLNEGRFDEGIAVAAALGVDFFTPGAARNLTDKAAQRAALRAGGLLTPDSALVPAGAALDALEAAVAQVGPPVVVKLARGRSSRSAVAIDDRGAVRAVAEAGGIPTGVDLVVESRIADGWQPGERPWADYVSVESFLSNGTFAHFSLTGRTPLATGFRETGNIMPSNLPRDQWRQLYDVAERAVRALGAHIGVFHTEIKLSPAGPRVIEVNGRLGGGGLTWLARRVAGRSLLRDVGRVALGLAVSFDDVEFEGVGFTWFSQPPADARAVVGVEGIDAARRIGGVDEVELARPSGARLDPGGEGSLGYVYAARGRVPGYPALWELLDELRRTVVVTYGDERTLSTGGAS